jgi:hypothetical protein
LAALLKPENYRINVDRTNLVMQELALQDDQLLLGQPRLLGLVPQLVKLLVLEETSPEDETKLFINTFH